MLRRLLGYLTLYGAHGLKVFSFVILIPHFTAIFPKAVWGQILIVQALSLWLQIVIEYGFNFSATRSMSRARESDEEIGRLVSGVISAKLFLSLIAIMVALTIYILFYRRSFPIELLMWSVGFAIMQGFSPIWYFLAREKFSQYARIDFSSRLLYLILCFFLIKNQFQGNMIFSFGIITATLANMIGYFSISREIIFARPRWADAARALKEGFAMFVFVGTTSIYTTLNIVILGLSQTTSVVAEYGTADRIVRSASGLLDPLNRIIYSRVTFMYSKDVGQGLAFVKRASWLIVGFALLVFSVGQLFSEQIIHLLAPSFSASEIYLKYLLLYIPVIAINNILGIHIMMALGMDRAFNTVFISVSIISAIFMLLLVPQIGVMGMIAITIGAELTACVGMAFSIRRSRALVLTQ
jgi:polysaccharide transporter, PST family